MIKKFCMATMIAVVFMNCQGDQGEPGPQGPQGDKGSQGVQGNDAVDPTQSAINGFISGTITGLRKDGKTQINESFEFKYTNVKEGFEKNSELSLYRYVKPYSGNNLISFHLLFENRGLANQKIRLYPNDSYGTRLFFEKELSGNKVFRIEARAVPDDVSVVYPVDPANTSYPFDFSFSIYSGSSHLNYEYLSVDNKTYYGFPTKDGATAYFYSTWNLDNPGAFYKVVNADGKESFASTIFGDLVLDDGPSGNFIFKDKEGVDLFKSDLIKADELTTSNFTYDAVTGSMSFDFVLTIGGKGRENNTRNLLTITGKFSGKVYDELINGRVSLMN